MTHYELGELVELLLRVGQAMLRAGAASFRTEETITRLGIGLGADRIEGYVTPPAWSSRLSAAPRSARGSGTSG